MRRSTRLGLVAAVVLLIVGAGVYTVLWLIAADRVKDGVAAWAEQARAQNLDIVWNTIRVSGWPLSFRIDLSDATLRNTAANPPVEVHTPEIVASTRPWDYRVWRIAARHGLSAVAGDAHVPLAKINAEAADASVAVAADGGADIWLGLRRAIAEPGVEPERRALAETADFWLSLPAKPVREHDDRNVAVAVNLADVTVPILPPPFASPIDLAFGATLMGEIPQAPPRAAAEAWRRSGGTVEVDHVDFAWGGLNMSGSGTMALDNDLQPTGAFSAMIGGYDTLIGMLTAAGNIKANDARVVRLALSVMARPGANGKPAITASFTIQNGQMYLGPARLGPVPRLNWQ